MQTVITFHYVDIFPKPKDHLRNLAYKYLPKHHEKLVHDEVNNILTEKLPRSFAFGILLSPESIHIVFINVVGPVIFPDVTDLIRKALREVAVKNQIILSKWRPAAYLTLIEWLGLDTDELAAPPKPKEDRDPLPQKYHRLALPY